MKFKNWLETQGYRGVGPSELKQAAAGPYRSPTMKSGDVYFDTGPDAHDTALQYVFQGGGGDSKLGHKPNSAGRGYVMKVDVPDGAAHYPDFQTDAGLAQQGSSYQAVPEMQPAYVSTVQSVKPNPQGPIRMGDIAIARPPVVGKPRNAQKFFQTYNRMFGKKDQSGST